MPMVAFIIDQTINETTNTKAQIEAVPSNCGPKDVPLLVRGTASVPHIPANKCTGIAPTTSSILNLVRASVPIITIIPVSNTHLTLPTIYSV